MTREPNMLLLHSFDINPTVKIQPTVYAPRGTMYLTYDTNPDLVKYLKSVLEAEKQMNDWIRAYDNLLKGLNYWKAKALERT